MDVLQKTSNNNISHYTKNAYEDLRVNALGKSNQSKGFAIFLHSGMSAWLKLMRNIEGIQSTKKSVISTSSNTAGVFGEKLTSIINDIILSAKLTEAGEEM